MFFKAIERVEIRTIAKGDEAGNAHIQPHDAARGLFCYHFAAGLNRRKPLAAGLADCDVANITQHVTAMAITQPAQLGQKNTPIALVKLAALRIAKAVAHALFLEAWEVSALLKNTKRHDPAKRRFVRCCWPLGCSSNLKA